MDLKELKEQARIQCPWCWREIPCAKDPELGWVHIDANEYVSRGMGALHRCEAQELSDQILAAARRD